MPKRRLILGILALGILAALIFHFTRPREPSYQGRSLSSWVAEIRKNSDEGLSDERAVNALRAIGTNALPYLLKWIQEDAPPRKVQLFEAVNRPLAWANPNWKVTPREWRHCMDAIAAFTALGPGARAAIPDLTKFMNDQSGSAIPETAAIVMPYLGQEALPPLLLFLTNQTRSQSARNLALLNMHQLGTNATPAVPAIIQCLADTNDLLAENAVRTLLKIRTPSPEIAAGLRKVLTDPRPKVRTAATNALRKIAPEALTNAPPK